MKHLNPFDDEQWFDFSEIDTLKKKFEFMLQTNEFSYMDTDSLEDLYMFYCIHKNFRFTEELLEFAFSLHPYHLPFYEFRFQNFMRTKEYVKALQFVEKALTYFPGEEFLRLNKAKALTMIRRYDSALEIYEELLATTNDKGDVYFQIASLYLEQNQYKLGFQLLKESYLYGNTKVYWPIVQSSVTNLDIDTGIKTFYELIDINPFDAECWLNLSTLYYEKGDFENALKSIDYCIALDDTQTLPLFCKANILSDLGRYDEELRILLDIQILDIKDEVTMWRIAECYKNMGWYDEARRYYKKYFEIDPNNPDAIEGLADCLYQLERYTEAVYYYQQCIKYHQESIRVTLKYIDAEIALNNYQSAVDTLEQIRPMLQDETEEEEFTLRETHLAALLDASDIFKILEDNFYHKHPNSAKIMYQCAAFAFFLGARSKGMFYLENALIRDFEQNNILFEYHPEIVEDEEVMFLIEHYRNL